MPTVRPLTPTAEQLGKRPVQLLVRGLFHRCPVCGGGKVVVRWFGLVDRCPTCAFRFNRIEGHSIGYVGLNTIVVFGVMFVSLMTAFFLTVPELPTVPLMASALIPATFGPIVFLPSSRTLWTAIDLLMRPLDPGECDPRFIVAEPTTGRPLLDD